MVRFVPMVPELFDLIPLSDEFRAAHLGHEPTAQAAACTAPNRAQAMLDGGRVMGAAGVMEVWPGRGYAWLLPGLWMERRHFVLAVAECRRAMLALETAGMWRIECTVLSGQAARARFVERMGFVLEGTMRCFGPDGADHDLWARLPATHRERRSLIERMA